MGDRWTRRALAVAGFGYPGRAQLERDDGGRWEPVFSVAEKAGLEARDSVTVGLPPPPPPAARAGMNGQAPQPDDEAEKGRSRRRRSSAYRRSRLAAVYGINRPNFHIDLEAAVEACEKALAGRDNDSNKEELS